MKELSLFFFHLNFCFQCISCILSFFLPSPLRNIKWECHCSNKLVAPRLRKIVNYLINISSFNSVSVPLLSRSWSFADKVHFHFKTYQHIVKRLTKFYYCHCFSVFLKKFQCVEYQVKVPRNNYESTSVSAFLKTILLH